MTRYAMRLVLLAALALIPPALSPAAARAGEAAPGPVCHLPAVLDVMTESLRLNRHYARIDPRSISETPTVDPRVVRCDVCVNFLLYDTVHLGEVPAARCEGQVFAVRILRNGYVVDPARP